ncbi:hypothetical protein F4818DRAFT_443750 [Hypoxylon cercidicola]|nr:hypothetical protein F4818DRAFT_443750 [Hypoxylon cercidicola]
MPSYSTLEVRRMENHRGDDSDRGFKETVFNHASDLQWNTIESDQPGVSGLQVVYHGSEPLQGNPPAIRGEAASRTSRVCGLPKLLFHLLLASGLLVIIGAIAGGVAGSLASRHDTNASQPGSNTNESNRTSPRPNTSKPNAGNPNVNILSISKLASTNRTDSNGCAHRAVFFQDTYNAIIARNWDGENQTWTTNNMTGSITPLNPTAGTQLASASGRWVGTSEVHLFFLVPDHHISSVYLPKPDEAPRGWRFDTLGVAALTLPGSQLAAMWQPCLEPGCRAGRWLVAYQNPVGVCVANASDPDSPAVVVRHTSVADNTSLALALLTERLSSGSVGTMQKSAYGAGQWKDGESYPFSPPSVSCLSEGERRWPDRRPTGAAVVVLDHLAQTMPLALLANGTVRATWWNGSSVPVPSVRFGGGPAGAAVDFTAIAASEDAMVYGIAGDLVLEYAPDGADPPGFRYVSTV